MPPYNRFERATIQAIQQAVAEVADGAASFTWDELAEKAFAVSGECMPTGLVHWCVLELRRRGIIGIEYADNVQATGVTLRRRLR